MHADDVSNQLGALFNGLELNLESVKGKAVADLAAALGQIEGVVPELPTQAFAREAARVEVEFFGRVNEIAERLPEADTTLLNEAKSQASMMVKSASKIALKTLTQMYDPAIKTFSNPHLATLRRKLEGLIRDMKCRHLDEVCHEREITDAYQEFCEGDEGTDTVRRASLMKLPRNVTLLTALINEAKKEFEREIKKPRELARKKRAEQRSNQKDWVPERAVIDKAINKGVELVKQRVHYTLKNVARRGAASEDENNISSYSIWTAGYPRSSLSSELNEYFFCVQEGVLTNAVVWGTRHEDQVAVAFEEACASCNAQAMEMYEGLVDRRITEIKSELSIMVMNAFGLEGGTSKPPKFLNESAAKALEISINTKARKLMALWDMTNAQEAALVGPILQQASALQAEAAAQSQSNRAGADPGTGTSHTISTTASSSSALRKRGRVTSPVVVPEVGVVDPSSGKSPGSIRNKRIRPDSLGQAKKDAEEGLRRRKQAFMPQQQEGEQPQKTATRSPLLAPGSKRKQSPVPERQPSAPAMEVEAAAPGDCLSPNKRRREAVAFEIGVGPLKARAPRRKRKAGDVDALSSSDASGTGNGSGKASGESALERSKRESKEALSQRAAAYVANMEARSSSKGKRKSAR